MRVYATPVLVPEASPHFDDFLHPGEHQIGFAGKRWHVEPIAEAHAVSKPPHQKLWHRVLPTDSAHVLRSLGWGDSVHGLL